MVYIRISFKGLKLLFWLFSKKKKHQWAGWGGGEWWQGTLIGDKVKMFDKVINTPQVQKKIPHYSNIKKATNNELFVKKKRKELKMLTFNSNRRWFLLKDNFSFLIAE